LFGGLKNIALGQRFFVSRPRSLGRRVIGFFNDWASLMDESLVVEKFHGSLDSQRVFRLSGPLTFETLPPLQNALRVETANSVFLDLTDVPYIDSAGLGSLVTACVSCNKAKRQLILSGVQPRVQRVFHITGVDRLFLIFDNIQDALDALTKPASA
jgi:anti-sigma B factor antagonist